jgi:hypothetical protein
MNPFSKLRSFSLFVIACGLTPLAAAAQTDSSKVDYSLFRFPAIDRKALDVTGGLEGLASNNTQIAGTVSAGQASFAQTMALRFSRFINRDNLQANQSIYFSPYYSASRSKSTSPSLNSDNRSYSFIPRIVVESEQMHYFKPNRFIGIEGVVSASYNEFKSQTLTTEVLRQQFNYDVSCAFRYGIGRIEPIDDVFLAKFMADDMRANGILNADLTQGELFELGRIMADARNRRIFDFRRQRIFELTQLSNWFAARGLDSKDNILFFTTLADNWLYSFFNTRSSGRRFSIGLAPEYSALHDEDNQLLPNRTLGLAFVAEYVCARPINQFWQWDQRIALRSGFTDRAFPTIVINRPGATATNTLTASASMGWYPSSRTFIRATAALAGAYIFSLNPQMPANFPHDAFLIQPSLALSGNYFLDYRTRLSFNLNTNYRHSSSTLLDPLVFGFSGSNQSAFQLSGNISLNYSLF